MRGRVVVAAGDAVDSDRFVLRPLQAHAPELPRAREAPQVPRIPQVGVGLRQPERLDAVKCKLMEHEVFKLSVTNALGCGQQKGYEEHYRGAVTEINLLKKVRLEIAVNDEFVQPTIEAITAAARTGKIGDGKIFIVPLEDCVRIRTGETGMAAIG